MMKYEAPPREYLKSEASVWWEMDKCPIPDGYDPWLVGPCIKLELEKLGYSGPITIFGLGNLKHVPEHVLQALSSTGIILKHVPTEISQPNILSFMHTWKNKIQAPYTIMLISDSLGFDLFYRSLSSLQKNYQCNILLAYKDPLKQEEYSLVTHEQWLWKSLLEDAKCRGTGVFSCMLCESDTQSLEEFTEHLKSEAHALLESGLQPWDSNDEMFEARVHPKRASTTMVKKQPMRKAKKMKMTYEHLPQQEEVPLFLA